MRHILFAFLMFASTALQASYQSEMIDALSTIRGIFEAKYAPKEWKKEFSGWDLNEEIEAAQQQVRDNPDMTIKEFQHLVATFFRSMHDYHVGVFFASTETSQLGFQVKSAEGRYFIVHIDRRLLSEDAFPFEVGDELVSFNGVHPDLTVQHLRDEYGRPNGSPDTEQAEAEQMLTKRAWFRGQPCPQGEVLVEVIRQGEEQAEKSWLYWVYEEELCREPAPIKRDRIVDWIELQGIAGFMTKGQLREGLFNRHAVGARKSYLPDLGDVQWRTDRWDAFDAYIYENEEGQTIGYVRIPHYDAEGDEWFWFAEIINRMEQLTDALVVDQLSNPGGVGLYCFALSSMLTDCPVNIPTQRMTIDMLDAYQARQLIPMLESIENDDQAKMAFSWYADPDLPCTLFGVPINFQFVRGFLEYNKALLQEWELGNRLTRPLPMMGMRVLNPSPFARYTKPILLLINEQDYSCGDYFPSILQDAGRVTTMGKKTSGAGGYVLGAEFPNSLGIYMMRYTGSVGMRVNQQPIEDLGVTPDIHYEPTVRDLQTGYQDYKEAINGVVQTLVQGE